MLYFPTWKTALVLAVCAFGVILSLPNIFSPETLNRLPSWIPHKQVSLGLDLRGGSHLLLEVDMKSVEKKRLEGVIDALRTELRTARIGYSGAPELQGDKVALQLRDTDRTEDLRKIVQKIDPDLEFQVNGSAVTVGINQRVMADARRRAVEQSVEIVRRRVDAMGTKEPTIQREGEDRILVQVPGVDDSAHLKDVIGKTARMTFQLVDTQASLEEAIRTKRAPAGDDLLPADANSRGGGQEYFLVRKRIMVSGDDLTDAQPTFQDNQAVVSFKFNSNGGRRFADATRENVGKPFAIVLDDKVISAPVIREPILGGSGVISGNFTTQSATDLALLLRAGALPAPLVVLEERTVGPDLGADSIHAGATASIVGVVLVAVFMILFYGLFGIFADVALFFNLCIMLAGLSFMGATLTLPGIAGIALTMGMAVDANVLIYERIREEYRNGRSMIASLQAGFERAFGTILDSHVTTLVAGALMFVLGSGPVKGFAVTLSLGVITSLFSAILVTRLQIITWLRHSKPKTLPI